MLRRAWHIARRPGDRDCASAGREPARGTGCTGTTAGIPFNGTWGCGGRRGGITEIRSGQARGPELRTTRPGAAASQPVHQLSRCRTSQARQREARWAVTRGAGLAPADGFPSWGGLRLQAVRRPSRRCPLEGDVAKATKDNRQARGDGPYPQGPTEGRSPGDREAEHPCRPHLAGPTVGGTGAAKDGAGPGGMAAWQGRRGWGCGAGSCDGTFTAGAPERYRFTKAVSGEA